MHLGLGGFSVDSASAPDLCTDMAKQTYDLARLAEFLETLQNKTQVIDFYMIFQNPRR